MPNRDGTGPQGKGPMTGAKRGNCEGSQNIEFTKGKGNQRCGQKKGMGKRWDVLDQAKAKE